MRSDGGLALEVAVRVASGERGCAQLLSEGSQRSNERVFQRRLTDTDLFDPDGRGGQILYDFGSAAFGICHHDVKPVAEALHIADVGLLYEFLELVLGF